MLEPFEVRFLAGRRLPNLWVIDLSKNDDILIDPQEYYRIQNMEDRLFIPEEFVSLFTEAGWEKAFLIRSDRADRHALPEHHLGICPFFCRRFGIGTDNDVFI